MTFCDFEEFLALLAVVFLTIGLIGFLINWMKSVSAKLDHITALLEEARA